MRQLKAAGIFPWSSLATRSGIVAGSLGVVCAGPKLINLLATYDPTTESGLSAPLDALREFAWPGLVFIVSTVGAALSIGFLISLLQTGGVFTWAALRAVRTRERVRNPFVSFVGFVIALNVACCLAYAAGPKIFLALGMAGEQPAAAYLGELLYTLIKLVVVASIVLAVVLVFVSRLTFLLGLKKRARRTAADET